jgi:hypothetical protein
VKGAVKGSISLSGHYSPVVSNTSASETNIARADAAYSVSPWPPMNMTPTHLYAM